MLSFHDTSKRILSAEGTFSKKRKRDDEKKIGYSTDQTMKSFLEPNNEDTLQLLYLRRMEWQRYLDVKSGQLYFLNTRTHERALTDPRLREEPSPDSTRMSLDLELNLPSQYSQNKHDVVGTKANLSHSRDHARNSIIGALNRSPSWLSFEVEEQEMVTAVCSKCYMLVMMCKSSPSCPNCKYMHPKEAEAI